MSLNRCPPSCESGDFQTDLSFYYYRVYATAINTTRPFLKPIGHRIIVRRLYPGLTADLCGRRRLKVPGTFNFNLDIPTNVVTIAYSRTCTSILIYLQSTQLLVLYQVSRGPDMQDQKGEHFSTAQLPNRVCRYQYISVISAISWLGWLGWLG